MTSETDAEFVERMSELPFWISIRRDTEWFVRLIALARRGAAEDSTSAVINLQGANDWLELENKRLKAAMQWRPIEEAPMDNKARLVWVPENRCAYCVYFDDGWRVFGGGWRDFLQRASHWMPLPPPPAGETNE